MQITPTPTGVIVKDSPGLHWLLGALFVGVGSVFVAGAFSVLAGGAGVIAIAAGVWVIRRAPPGGRSRSPRRRPSRARPGQL